MHKPLLVLLLFLHVSAQIPNCASGVTCPPGGIWSDWVNADDRVCPTTCGACSKLLQKRTCLTTSIGCNCIGDTTRYVPCNNAQCAYPAQRTCCIPYSLMKIDGVFQCGPLPKNESTTSCCPVEGALSEWSGYSRNNADTSWIRTRRCLSTIAGCPCTAQLLETRTDCPCKQVLDEPSGKCTKNDYTYPDPKPQKPLEIDTKTCRATVDLTLGVNKNPKGERYCGKKDNYEATAFRLNRADGNCLMDNPFNCTGQKEGSTLKVYFTCDMKTANWRYDPSDAEVTSYYQYVANSY